MLRPEVFDGILCGTLQLSWPHKEFVLRRYENVKCLAVAHHIENVRGNNGRLADHANQSGPSGQDKAVYLMILVDQAGICRARSGTHLHGSIQSMDSISLPVIGFDKLCLVSVQLRPDGCWWSGVLLAGGASCQYHRKQHNYNKSTLSETACQSVLPTYGKQKNYQAAKGRST